MRRLPLLLATLATMGRLLAQGPVTGVVQVAVGPRIGAFDGDGGEVRCTRKRLHRRTRQDTDIHCRPL